MSIRELYVRSTRTLERHIYTKPEKRPPLAEYTEVPMVEGDLWIMLRYEGTILHTSEKTFRFRASKDSAGELVWYPMPSTAPEIRNGSNRELSFTLVD